VSGCFQETRKLPALFARLPSVTLIVIASTAATTTKSLSAAAAPTSWPVRLRLRFVDLQRASAQLRPIQRSYRLVRFRGIRHLHKSETARPAGLPVGHDAHFFHRTMSLEYGPQLGLGCAVGQISYVKVLHYISSFNRPKLGFAAFIFSAG
jgi:hypothetical protein